MSGPTDGTTVGVVGDHPEVVAAVEAAGCDPLVGDASTVTDAAPSAVVAIGEESLLAAVRAEVDVPTLPVDAGRAVRSVPGASVELAIERLVTGRFDAVSYPTLGVDSPLGVDRALMDVMLVTAEPARISEYAVASRGRPVARFRSDGVTVATPAGSQGYTRSADGPVLSPETDVATVVPVAPFAIDENRWVLPQDGIELTVARDETSVELLVDDQTAGTVGHGHSVRLSRDGEFPVAVVEESVDFFG